MRCSTSAINRGKDTTSYARARTEDVLADETAGDAEDPEVIRKLGVRTEQTKFFRGRGCSDCKRMGYSKRIGLFELLIIDEDIRRLILAKSSNKDIKALALKKGMVSMRVDGLRKAEKGLTTVEEVLKATMEEEE